MDKLKISVALTVYNEEKSISSLLRSLLNQSKKPDEIIIVDSDSEDGTTGIIKKFQKKSKKIKLLIQKSSRAKARNLAVELARNEIIAMTDAGCIPQKDWLKNLTAPFITTPTDVSAGFYKMTGKNSMQKASAVFLGVTPGNFGEMYLPATRSIAFTKKVFDGVGGFSEKVSGAAEDTVFNFKLLENNAKFTRVKNAVVEWGMPETLSEFFWKIYSYSRGDSESKIYMYPQNNIMSHNIKSILILCRYFAAAIILSWCLRFNQLPFFGFLTILYMFWAYRKVYLEYKSPKVALWGPILQITSDFGVMLGYLRGLI